jgi:hypothetical protein
MCLLYLGSETEILYDAYYMYCPSYSSWFNHWNDVWCRLKILKILTHDIFLSTPLSAVPPVSGSRYTSQWGCEYPWLFQCYCSEGGVARHDRSSLLLDAALSSYFPRVGLLVQSCPFVALVLSINAPHISLRCKHVNDRFLLPRGEKILTSFRKFRATQPECIGYRSGRNK